VAAVAAAVAVALTSVVAVAAAVISMEEGDRSAEVGPLAEAGHSAVGDR
jgi:hypothetical protein